MKLKNILSRRLKEEGKGQLWIPMLVGIALFFLQTVNILISFERWEKYEYRLSKIQQLCVAMWRGSLKEIQVVFLVAVAAGILSGLYSFLYLHSSRKVDFYHSLPMGREGLFFSRLMIQLRHYALPSLLVLFLSICACAVHGEFSLRIVWYGLVNVFFQIQIFLMSYGLTVLAVVLTGRPLLAILGTAVFLSYGRALGELVVGYMEMFWGTFSSYGTERLSRICDPFMGGMMAYEEALQKNHWGGMVCYLFVVLALWSLNYYLYRKRPSEAAGCSMAFSHIGSILKYVLEIPMILGTGLIFQMMSYSGGGGTGWWVFGLVVGALFSHCAVEILYSMNVKSCVEHRRQFVLTCLVSAAIVLVFRLDLVGYNTYYPAQEKLESIGIQLSSLDNEFVAVLDDSSGDETEFAWIPASGSIYQKLKNLVDSKENEDRNRELVVRYALKSGRMTQRSYALSRQEAAGIMEAVCTTPEYLDSRWPDWQQKKEALENAWLNFSGYNQVYYDRSSGVALDLLEALKKDMEEADASVYMSYPVGSVQFTYEYESGEGLVYIHQTEPWILSDTDTFYIFPGFRRVMSILEEQGVHTGFQADGVEKVTLVDMRESTDQPVEIVYEDRSDIEKALSWLIAQDTWCAWLPYTDLYYARISLVDENGAKEEIAVPVDISKVNGSLTGGSVVHTEDVVSSSSGGREDQT